jgi:hypothetical protein
MSNQGDQSTSQTQSSRQEYYTQLARIAMNYDLAEVNNMILDHLQMLRDKRMDRACMLIGMSEEGPTRVAELEEQIEHHRLCVQLYQMIIKRKVRK